VKAPRMHFENCTVHVLAPPTFDRIGNFVMGVDLRTSDAAAYAGSRFELPADGTYVIDHKTGLMWSRDESKRSDFDDADAHCRALRFGGFSDWRLPTLDELQTIVDRSRYSPAIDTNVFNTNAGWTWTSDEYKGNPDPSGSVWIVDFLYGDVGSYGRSSTAFARAVRAVPAGQ